MAEVFIGKKVNDLISFYKPILDQKLEFDSIAHLVNAFGTHAYNRYLEEDYRSIPEFNNYNRKYIGISTTDIIASQPTKNDFLDTAATTFGYQNYSEAEKDDRPIDKDFEQAVDLLLAGELTKLNALIEKDHSLIKRSSQYPHSAALIHYVGSNGVEFWRQVVPSNLVEILEYLLSIGCDPDQENNIYGGSTLKGLITSSAHPKSAGLTEKLVALL